jgi:colanic acid/amylovoran biosynthesis glycosyltransferase
VKRKKLILVTENFPFTLNYETFLETEIRYLAEQAYFDVVVMPISLHEVQRDLPPNITLDLRLARCLRKKQPLIESVRGKLFYMLKAFTQKLFRNELRLTGGTRISKMKELLLALRRFELYYACFKTLLRDNSVGTADAVFYTYWYTEATYALQALKPFFGHKVITRTHRYDLYEEETFTKYMPLRRQFVKDIDRIYTITDSAIDYLSSTYGIDKKNIMTSRLGVDDKQIISKPTEENEFHIVSCSALRPVKRVDLIIDLLEKLASHYPGVSFLWWHIGAGPLDKEIETYADDKLSGKNNLQYRLLGMLSNEEVYAFYGSQAIDVFINASESEGVPVSIMEAMSCHIPVVASNVGGISDMIQDGYNGKILSGKPDADGFFAAFTDLSFFKDKTIRANAYSVFRNKYLASDNYRGFISSLTDLKMTER